MRLGALYKKVDAINICVQKFIQSGKTPEQR